MNQQQRITLPPLHTINNQGDVLEHPIAEAALYRIRPQAPIQILCTDHTDTVFPQVSPFQTCWQENDRLRGHFGPPPKSMDAKHQALFEQLKYCGELIGIPISWRNTGGGCEGNNLAASGLPTIDTLGVRGGAIHSEDEFMCMDNFVERTQLSVLSVSRMSNDVAKDSLC